MIPTRSRIISYLKTRPVRHCQHLLPWLILQVLDLWNFIFIFISHTALCLHILYLKVILFVFIAPVCFPSIHLCMYIYIYMCYALLPALKKNCLCFIKISHSLDNLGLRATLLNTWVKTSSSPLYSGGTGAQKDKTWLGQDLTVNGKDRALSVPLDPLCMLSSPQDTPISYLNTPVPVFSKTGL